LAAQARSKSKVSHTRWTSSTRSTSVAAIRKSSSTARIQPIPRTSTFSATFNSIVPVPLGAPETANARRISKHIHLEGVQSCQLVMGVTQLDEGSVWNTMPPHTHMRRSEVYLYFDLPPADRVIHLMGPPQETRHLVVANKQVVISPGWSIHAGVGTRNYSFCWGMGGENQVYTDMDPAPVSELR